MSNALIELRAVRKTFPQAGGELTILDGIHLTVDSGMKVAICGESGCGKSTLLNIVGGLESPTSGSIVAGSYQVESLNETEMTAYRSSFLGLIFQFHYLLKDFTALENVIMPALIAGTKKSVALDRARSLLAEVRLEQRAHHYPAQMSGGERQRVAVARSLINEPSLVLADEPTGNLDPGNAEIVRDLLFSVVSDHRATLLLVTHDATIAALADKRYRLEKTGLIAQ